jgi:glycosyltransferase involved in cell wall biosynthesis
MSPLKLSVVMPNYNHASYLDRVIGTVVGQSRPPDEFIILDDGSTDDSLSRIAAWVARYPSIRLEKNATNTGVIAAHQRLFGLATGDYLYPASADDDLLPGFFQRAMEMAQQYPQAGALCGQMVIADAQARELDLVDVQAWREPLYAPPERFLREYLEVEEPSHALTSSTIFRRRCLEEVGWFRPELGSWSDTFAFRAIGLKHGICFVPERFAIWRRMPQNFSEASRRDQHHLLDLVARAAQTMRRPEFRDRFPESHVQRWARRYKWRVVKDYLRGDLKRQDGGLAARCRFYARCLWRSVGALRLASYRGSVGP